LADKSVLNRTVEIDASKYVGKSVGIGVLVHGPSGRDDGWSIISLEVLPVLAAPRDLTPVDARDAVHLQWSADAPAFRIFRRQATGSDSDAEWVQIGDSTQASFDDKTFEYGKTWQYYVLAVRKVGDKWMESYPSETITFTPVDRFPPAVPGGLVVIPGIRTIELSWERVADSDVAGYRVYRNGVKIAEGLQTNSYSDKDVVAGTKYSYQVSAVDQAGNESGKSGAQEAVLE
jgi:fibronectin type 3 domain-containing protein